MTASGTGDAVFILGRLTEKYWSKGKKLFYYSIYLSIYLSIYIPQDIKIFSRVIKILGWCPAGPVLPHEEEVSL